MNRLALRPHRGHRNKQPVFEVVLSSGFLHVHTGCFMVARDSNSRTSTRWKTWLVCRANLEPRLCVASLRLFIGLEDSKLFFRDGCIMLHPSRK